MSRESRELLLCFFDLSHDDKSGRISKTMKGASKHTTKRSNDKLRKNKSSACNETSYPIANSRRCSPHSRSISGLVVEYIVAIDVTRARFPADAYMMLPSPAGCFASVPTQMVEISMPMMQPTSPNAHLYCISSLPSAEDQGRKSKRGIKGAWCSGITSASHAEGPGFNPQRVHASWHDGLMSNGA